MQELVVPTRTLEVEIVYGDGRSHSGRIFLPAVAHHHEGPMRPDEWIREGGSFFPFLPTGRSRAVLLNKRQLVALSVPRTSEEQGREELPERIVRVEVECGERRFCGELHIDMPEGRSRVLDYANRDEAFLALADGDRYHLIRKVFITRISEIAEV